MQIFITSNYSPWSPYSGGGQYSVHHLATALQASGQSVDVIYTKSPLETVHLPQDLTYRVHWANLYDVKSRRQSLARRFTCLSVAKKIRVLAKDNTPFMIHANGEEGAMISSLREKASFRLVTTPRYPRYPSDVKPVKHLWKALISGRSSKMKLLSKTLKDSDLVLPTSHYAHRQIHQTFQIDGKPTHIIPNGVDTCFRQTSWREDLDNGPLVFYGRLERSKGVDTLLEAFAALQNKTGQHSGTEQLPGAGPHSGAERQPPGQQNTVRPVGSGRQLYIIGRGNLENWIRDFIAGKNLQDQVHHLSWMSQTQLANILREAALAILPSREESFGNAVAEAMSVGIPVITTSAGSLPELVEHGLTGWMVPPGEATHLERQIQSVLANPSRTRQVARQGRKYAREQFDWSRVAGDYLSIYRQLLESPASLQP